MKMKHSRTIPRQFLPLLLMTAAFGLLAVGCTQEAQTPIPLPTARVPSILEINNAISIWEAGANENYFISVEETTPDGDFLFRVVMVDGEIQAAQRLERIDGEWRAPRTIDPETAENYTVDALLARILRDATGQGSAPLNMFVTFDDMAGFPTLVEAKAMPSYTEDGRIRLNREHSYTLSIGVDVLLEESFGLNKEPVLTLTRSGGENAACSTLRIFKDDTSIYTDNCRQILLQINPPASSLEELDALLAVYGPLEDTRSEDTTNSRLLFQGSGSETPGPEVLQHIWDLALDLNQLLSQPIGAGVTLLRQWGDLVVGFDMRTNLEQPATLDVQSPLYGGVSDQAGKRIVYADGAGIKWLDVDSGEHGTVITNPADTHYVPVEIAAGSTILLQRFTGSSGTPEWGWITFESRSWKPIAPEVTCIAEIRSSPDGRRAAVASQASPECTPEAAVWIVDLETGEADPIDVNAAGATSAAWAPDGIRLGAVLQGQDGDGTGGLYLIDIESGTLTELIVPVEGSINSAVWNPGGDRLVYGLTGAGDGQDGLYEYSLVDRQTTNYLDADNVRPLAFDPGGEFLAFQREGDLGAWLLAFDQVISITRSETPASRFFGWIDSRQAD